MHIFCSLITNFIHHITWKMANNISSNRRRSFGERWFPKHPSSHRLHTFKQQDVDSNNHKRRHIQVKKVKQSLQFQIDLKSHFLLSLIISFFFKREKVTIPLEKPCIYLRGEGTKDIVITWNGHGAIDSTATFTSLADNIIARGIKFVVRSLNLVTCHSLWW